MISALRQKSFRAKKKIKFWGFRCSTREDLSINDHLNVAILTGESQQIFGFPWCSTREDLSIDVSITNVGLILTKL